MAHLLGPESCGRQGSSAALLILTELLRGFARDADYRQAKSLLIDIPCAELGSRDVTLAAADNYRTLRKRGITVWETIDMIITASHVVFDRHAAAGR